MKIVICVKVIVEKTIVYKYTVYYRQNAVKRVIMPRRVKSFTGCSYIISKVCCTKFRGGLVSEFVV